METELSAAEHLKYIEHVDAICNHIENVQTNCKNLGEELIKVGEVDLGRKLISNGYIHDNSKFYGIEFDGLFSEDKNILKLAVEQHNTTNKHHPEYWGGIKNMPRLFLAEMVCDVCARASEFGTSIRDWIDEDCMKKYKFTKRDKVYKDIKYFLSFLLDEPFKPIK